MESISAKSHHELQALLVGIDISVPHRGDQEDKRTTAHVERWSICKFLATYGHTRFIRYPLLVEKRERPDYRMSSRDLMVGIEITEAVSQDMARIDAMRYDEDEIFASTCSCSAPELRVARRRSFARSWKAHERRCQIPSCINTSMKTGSN